ncbi:MAG: exo-alpha-sialidase [Planctomycetes bacterium]|nr:exo-alpha-sialidase [Planctomycetota bacterium]
MRTLLRARLAALALAAAPALAQIPAHATLLNPNGPDYREYRLARSDRTVHLFGVENPTQRLFHSRSADRGRTFPTTNRVIGFALGRTFGVAVEGNVAVVGIVDYGPMPLPVQGGAVLVSTDDGQTWSYPRGPRPAPGRADVVRVHLHSGVISLFWAENGNALWSSRSTDLGMTWTPAQNLAPGFLPGGVNRPLELFASGDVLDLFWEEQSSGLTAHQRSVDNGQSWLPAAHWISSAKSLTIVGGPTIFHELSYTPFVPNKIRRSTDGGLTWSLVTGLANITPTRLAADGDRVMVAEDGGSNNVSAVSTSTDAGQTWQLALLSPRTSGIFVGGGAFFSRHHYFGPSGSTVGLHQSSDGVAWRVAPVHCEYAFHPDERGSLAVRRALVGPTYGGPLYLYVAEGHTALGTGSAGTGGVVPRLDGRGLAALGATFQLELEATRGGAAGAWFHGIATANVPVGPATLYVAQPVGPIAFVAGGASGTAGVGSANLAFAVPPNALLSGLRLVTQAFVLDPAVAAGFAASDAVESWVY